MRRRSRESVAADAAGGFPKARLRVRSGRGVCGAGVAGGVRREGLEYVMCLAGNPTLKRAAAGLKPVWKEYQQTGIPQERTATVCMERGAGSGGVGW